MAFPLENYYRLAIENEAIVGEGITIKYYLFSITEGIFFARESNPSPLLRRPMHLPQ